MALAGLIIGCAEADGAGGAPRAALPLLGGSLVEHQARLAAAAGAGHIVILVERVPAALTATIDRLKRDGIAAELARSVADAADRIHPEERLLLIGDGIVASREQVVRVARLPAPALLTLPDTEPAFERLDASARWAGLAVTDGATLRRTVAMLGEWDLQSTLLRRLVQAGATRVEAAGRVRLVGDAAQAREAESALVGGGAAVRHAASAMSERALPPLWLRGGALALAGLAIPALASDWIATGGALLALAGLIDLLPRRIEEAALIGGRRGGWWRRARLALTLVGIAALGWSLWREAGWGVWPLVASIAGAGVLLDDQARRLARRLPDPAWAGVALLLGGALGEPVAALAAIAAALFVALLRGQRAMGSIDI